MSGFVDWKKNVEFAALSDRDTRINLDDYHSPRELIVQNLLNEISVGTHTLQIRLTHIPRTAQSDVSLPTPMPK